MLANVAEVVEEAKNIGVMVDLLDKVFKKVLKACDHQEFPQKVISIKGLMVVLQKKLDTSAKELKEAEDKMLEEGNGSLCPRRSNGVFSLV